VPTAPPTTLAEPLVPPVVPTELPTAPSGVDTPTVDPVLEPETPALRELFATTPDQRLRPPPVDARAATTTQAPPAADAEPRAAAPPAEIAAPVLRVVQRDGSHFTLRPVVAAADAASTAPADWLPATTGHASTHAATATHSAAAPAQASLDMNAPDWHEAFASRVQWLVDTKVGEAHIKLNPPELGAVDVKISLVDDQTFVQLTAATPSARDELSHGLPRLRELLIAGGLDLGGASVHSGRDGRHEAGGYASQAATRLDPAVLDPAHHDEPTASAPRRIASRIDVFA
jgi:flagellar hook-length control protein FliK